VIIQVELFEPSLWQCWQISGATTAQTRTS